MPKFIAMLLSLLVLPSCSDYVVKQDANHFADASSCLQASKRKENQKVPTEMTMTIVEIPLGNDANAYTECMLQKGHAPPPVKPDDYLNASRACMSLSRNALKPIEAYAKCIRHGKVSAETIPSKDSH
jgi:hypothetical protein